MNIFTISRFSVFLLLLSFSLSYGQSYKQKQNNIWLGADCDGCPSYKGLSGSGLDFNGDSIKSIAGIEPDWVYFHTSNGAAISDAKGNLLFYTDGNIVYNRNHKVMTGGWDINNTGQLPADSMFVLPDGASSENFDGVVIIPMPGSSHEYYIFTVPQIWREWHIWNSNNSYSKAYAPEWYGKLYYSIVDMELNSGMGGLKHRGVFVEDSMAGNLHGVVGNNCDYWLLGYGSSGYYKAFHITSSGVNNQPVISVLNPPLSPYIYELNISPSGRKVAMAAEDYVEVSDFNPNTGLLSNATILPAQVCRSLAFSPNDSLLYLSGITGVRQYQSYSLSNPANLLMVNNYTSSEYDGPLRLATDGKIYFSYGPLYPNTNFANYPMCIQNPNLLGLACNIDTIGPGGLGGGRIPVDHPLPFLVRTFNVVQQFPNEVPILLYDSVAASKNIPLCFNAPSLLEPQLTPGTDYHWYVNTINDAPGNFKRIGGDSTTKLLAAVPGIYAVQYFTSSPCQFHQDTFFVEKAKFSLYLGKDTTSCNGQAIELKVDIADAEFLWQDGSTKNSYLAGQSGFYWVRVNKDGCTATDSIIIDVINVRQDLGSDTAICMEGIEGLTLRANVPEGAVVSWNTGSQKSVIQVIDSGVYWVTVTYKSCVGMDSIYIQKQYCICPYLMPNAFSPNNDGNNDLYKPEIVPECTVDDYQLNIYNRWGQLVFSTTDLKTGWNGTFNGAESDIGTYYYHLQMTSGLRGNLISKKGDFLLVR